MSVQTDDAGVSVTSVISPVVEVFDEDKWSELIKEGVDVPVAFCPHSFVISCTNSYGNWGQESRFTSAS